MKRTNPLAPIRLLVEAVEQDHELCIGTGDFGDGDEPCPTCDVLAAAKEALEQVEYNEMLVASAGAQAQELERATARLARLEAALRGLLGWAVELDDERLSYLVVQVDRVDVAAAQAVLEGRDE